MGISEPEVYMKKLKLGFFKRLITNEYTHLILKQLFNLKYLGCFDQEMKTILNLKDDSTLEEAQLAAEVKLIELNRRVSELKDTKNLSGTALEVHRLLHSNRTNLAPELFDLLKY